MQVIYIGNFRPAHSTESHVAQALEANGVEVVRAQEDEVDWARMAKRAAGCDFVLWTSTHDYSPVSVYPDQRDFLHTSPVPVIGYHLDIWWGLGRAYRVREAPFFRCTMLVTADGAHDNEWADANVNHHFMPPGVSEFECTGGERRPEFTSAVAFVGSWQGTYHPEHDHRAKLIRHLQKRSDVAFWPKKGQHAIRGQALRDLYRSVAVVVGDSCFAGRVRNYHSDRIPETLGRGGFLLHPSVEGVTDGTLYKTGEHLGTWRAGDWDVLDHQIEHYLAHPDEARATAIRGQAHVLEHHTYTVRMRQLIQHLRDEGLLSPL